MTYPIQPEVSSSNSTSLSSTPIRSSLLQNLTTQTQLITHLFTHLTSPNPSALSTSSTATASRTTAQIPSISIASSSSPSDPINTLYTALHSSTADLEKIVQEVYRHQDAYSALMEKREEVMNLERRVRTVLRELEKGRKELEGMVEEGKEVRKSIEQSEKEPLSVQPLLAHAQSLATHSSAPVSSLLLPLDKAQYMPWPTETSMRQGLLFALQGSMSGIGDLGKIGDESKEAPRTAEEGSHVIQEENTRRFDPNAVYDLDLNSDSEDE